MKKTLFLLYLSLNFCDSPKNNSKCNKSDKVSKTETKTKIVKNKPVKVIKIKSNKTIKKPLVKIAKPKKVIKKLEKCPKITPENYIRLSQTGGKHCLRKFFINKRDRIQRFSKKYELLGFHHLFETPVLWVNNKEGILTTKNRYRRIKKTGITGKLFRLHKGDKVTTKAVRDDMGFTKREIWKIRSYYAYKISKHTDNTLNRTYSGRLKDHNILLKDIINNPETPTLKKLNKILNPSKNQKFVFIDVGAGIANKDTIEMEGKGIPAITSIEMAKDFPDFQIIVLDLPRQVNIFTGKEEGFDKKGKKYNISEKNRNYLLSFKNIHIISGNGLVSLLSQWKNSYTNPYRKTRKRFKILKTTSVIIRIVNSLDVYCKWHTSNGKFPSVKKAIRRLAKDFKTNPVLLFFNKEIIIKERNRKNWRIIGEISDVAFCHNTRTLNHSGQKPYKLIKNY
jgi:hypothetical protein